MAVSGVVAQALWEWAYPKNGVVETILAELQHP